MSTVFVGELDIAACIPGAVSVLLVAQADLQAKLTAMIAFSAQLGLPALSLQAQLNLAAQITTSLQAALTIGLTPPSISAQFAAALQAIATLTLQLQVYIDLFALLAHAGVFVYAIDSATNAAGAELTAALAAGFPGHGPTDHANVLVLGTVSGATWSAMQAVFRTS